MGSVLRVLADYGPAFGQALLLTWKLTAISFVAGFALGIVVTVGRLLPLRPLRLVLTTYVEVFRNIPSVALLIFVVFALPDLNVLIDYEPSVILTLTLVPALLSYAMPGEDMAEKHSAWMSKLRIGFFGVIPRNGKPIAQVIMA
jgi:His/Glu/Gln/Arg/opine family amino acid ABC transporter permease subunit